MPRHLVQMESLQVGRDRIRREPVLDGRLGDLEAKGTCTMSNVEHDATMAGLRLNPRGGSGRTQELLVTCPRNRRAGDTLTVITADGSALDASGSGAVAERDGATLRLKEGGGVFYAPGPLQSVAVHWPRLVAGAQSGALYHLEVQG